MIRGDPFDFPLEDAPYWSFDSRMGIGLEKSLQEVDCEDCTAEDYLTAVLLALDMAYLWSDFLVGLPAASWGSLFGSKGGQFGATVDWSRKLLPGLEIAVVGELGARLEFGALLVAEVGLVAGVWGSAQLDLMTKEFELESPSTFTNGPIQKNIRVGGHLLAAGLSLVADF